MDTDITNYAAEFPTFGEMARVSTFGVQWISPLALPFNLFDLSKLLISKPL